MHARPRAIVLGGQPGAGKSAMQGAAEQELLPRGGALSIVGDDLRAYHPRYAELLGRDDKTAAFYTDRDSGRWVEKLIAYAREQKFDVVIEGTMRLPDKVAQTFIDLRSAGYKVQARVLAVRAEFSELGIRQRYEQFLADRGHARFTTPRAHQAAYEGLPASLARIERERLADAVRLYARGNVLLYANRQADGVWQAAPKGVDTLHEIRTRVFAPSEKAELALGWHRVWTTMEARGAAAAELEQVRPMREAAFVRLHSDWRAVDDFRAQVDAQTFLETKRLGRAVDRGLGR
ncbi:MAG TPA: zeta toxin family protein [Polyangiales bacterium]|nr:zeta toxin family protein [Polyangiales bacterium]